MAYEDSKHRPHAIHTGEEPRQTITRGPEGIRVSLDRWGPTQSLFTSMYDALQANWGDTPSRTVLRTHETTLPTDTRVPEVKMALVTGWSRLTMDERDYVEACFAGKTLQQVLEGITFDFCIDGVSRAFTHQNVRTRLGAGFMQHGGRDNDWRHRSWTMPETMHRMCVAYDKEGSQDALDLFNVAGMKHPIENWSAIEAYMDSTPTLEGFESGIRGRIEQHIMTGRRLYAALVDAGIPWQDARRVLFMGMQTYIHDQYNWLALKGVLANRLEHIMDWEFNCVAQLMLREVRMKCPPIIWKYMGSHSDLAKSAKFAGLESWPPDGKWPNPYERCGSCGHAKANHRRNSENDPNGLDSVMVCEVCERENQPGFQHEYFGVDSLPRQHRPEQNPFWVLHPDSMAGGPIVWVATNGSYPHDVVNPKP